MPTPTIVELFEAGVHFGHKKERSHPKAKEFIFTLKDGVYVIDLDKTTACLAEALSYLKKQISEGKTVLFVGTKRQAKEIIKSTAEALAMPYVIKRWLGGTLTNFETIQKSIREMEKLEERTKSPEFEALTKKEKKIIQDKITKFQGVFEGLRQMRHLPDALFILDAAYEKLAVAEANKINIPVAAICDTDANPENIDYPIPANDDAAKSVNLIMNQVLAMLKGSQDSQKELKTEVPVKKEETKVEKPRKIAAKKAVPTGRQEKK